MSKITTSKSTTSRKKRMAMAVAAGSMAAAASLASVGSASAGTLTAVRVPVATGPQIVPIWWCCGVPADIFKQMNPGDLTIPAVDQQIQFGG
jgi:hypothetical protein